MTPHGFVMTHRKMWKKSSYCISDSTRYNLKYSNERVQHLAELHGMLNSDQSGFRPQWLTEDQVIRLSQAISDGFQERKPPYRTVLTLLDFSKAYNKVWRADLLATMLRKGVPVRYVRWIQGFLSNRQARVRLNRAFSRSWMMREGVPQGSVLAPL
jgi:hypothetical protein